MKKPSMYNYFFENDKGELILYNSYTGQEGISLISTENKELVKKWLGTDKIDEKAPLFDELFKKGFFVNKEVNEKKRREWLINDHLQDNELDLTIHTTKACNFRCNYCALDFENEPMSLKVQNAIVNFIEKNISNYTGVSISWFGGEPLLEMDVINNISQKVIKLCKRAKKRYSGHITTNGYLLNNKNIRMLLDNRVYGITVTIDGLKEHHDQYRVLKNGSETFDVIINNLVNIKNNYPNKALYINIRSNITNKILGKLDEYYDFYNNLFGDDSRFSMFVKPVGDWGGERVKSIKDSLIGSGEIADVYNFLSHKTDGINFSPNLHDLNTGGVSCPARNKNKFTFCVDGNVNKCDDSSLSDSIGLLDEKGSMDIDIDKVMGWTSAFTGLDKECDNCFYSCNCFGCFCPKHTYYEKKKACALDLKELEALIKLYVNTEDVSVLT